MEDGDVFECEPGVAACGEVSEWGGVWGDGGGGVRTR